MAKRQVFYSFHYDKDVFRVQQIRNIGAIEGNQLASANEWEEVKRKGETAIKKWIDDNMAYRSCVIVLVGEETSKRKWVDYEIRKAWNDKKGLFGIYIHNINCMRNGTCRQGKNPFENIAMSDGSRMSDYVKVYNPYPLYAYPDISNKMEGWIELALKEAENR